MFRRSLVIAALAALAVGVVSDSALAQFYRGKTITMIINYPAGGPSDIEGRIIAQHLPAHIPGKPTIVIRNVGGAGGVIGTNQLGEAAPNGETIGFFTLDIIAQLLSNPALRVNYADFLVSNIKRSPPFAASRRSKPRSCRTRDSLQTRRCRAGAARSKGAWATPSSRCGRSRRAPGTAAIRAAPPFPNCRRSKSSTPR
jgi:hypothetical protein